MNDIAQTESALINGPVKMTILAENTVRRADLIAEHGWSVWIETGKTEAGSKRILFDTGQGFALKNNAKALGVNLAAADALVLSHGHYDHAGALAFAAGMAPEAPIYAHPEATAPRFSIRPGQPARAIGLSPRVLEMLEAAGDRIVYATEPTPLPGGLWLTGEIARKNDFEDTGGPFFLDAEGTRPDPLRDDQAIYFDTSEGIVLLLGCAHSGVINTMEKVASLTGGRPYHCVMGGMHLVVASPERMRRTVEAFGDFKVQRIGLAHCTGESAMATLNSHFPGQCFPCPVGSSFTFGQRA